MPEHEPITWDPVKRWLRGKETTTKNVYQIYFKQFLVHAGKTYGFTDPLGFLEWARRERQWIVLEETINDFASTLKTSIKPIALSAIKTFLKTNGCDKLTSMKIEPYRNSYIEGYTREQIIALLSYLKDPLQKLFVLFGKDDGFRGNTNLDLKWHHIKKDFDNGEKFIHLKLEEEYYHGRKPAGFSFIGPDCTWLLKQLIEDGTIATNPRTCDLNRPETCNCKRIFPWALATISESINLAKEKAKLPSTIQPTHGLRKFFENALDLCQPRLDKDKKNQLEGHSLGVRQHYTAQVETLRPLYERAYPHLSLSEDALADQKMKAVLEELRTLRDENRRMKQMEADIETLKLQLAARVEYTPR